MSNEFDLMEIDSQPVLYIEAKTEMWKMGQVMGELFGEVWAHIQQQGAQPGGVPYCRYMGMSENSADIQCGLPVSSAVAGGGRVRAGELPSGLVARNTYLGPYDGLGEAHGALMAWIAEQGYDAAGPPWEAYVSDPGEESDPHRLRTDIFVPVAQRR